MDSKRFRRKKFSPQIYPKFPYTKNNEPHTGIFDGHSVSVYEKDATYDIYIKGNFGKGSLSRSAPACIEQDDDLPPIILEQQWQNHLKWKIDDNSQTKLEYTTNDETKLYYNSIRDFLKFAFSNYETDSWKKYKAKSETVEIDISAEKISEASNQISGIEKDSNSDPVNNMVEEILQTGKMKEPRATFEKKKKLILVAENTEDFEMSDDFNISTIKIKLRNNLCYGEECLKLNLSEAFFLCFALGCLKIFTCDGREMNLMDLWGEFCKTEKNFIEKYVAYHHYRAYGWTVRSGLKFGGDYLLYKIGPKYYHAAYLVWILNKRKKNKMTWDEFIALNRLVETCNKDLLLCEILGPETTEGSSPDILNQFSILELVSKRWIPSLEREQKDPENR